jgi:hypothetical protein
MRRLGTGCGKERQGKATFHSIQPSSQTHAVFENDEYRNPNDESMTNVE